MEENEMFLCSGIGEKEKRVNLSSHLLSMFTVTLSTKLHECHLYNVSSHSLHAS